MSVLLTKRLANSEMILRQLRHLAGHIPCELCELKGGTNIESDGGCRHRPLIDTDASDLEVIQRIERFFKKHHDKLMSCNECGTT